jgi:DNA-binding HxlR family transcriptional regulator
MQKKKNEKIREAQGKRSKMIAYQNQMSVFLTLLRKPLTFSELLKETGFSKPVLAKHLKASQADGWICKDTIKADETSNPKEIGKVVYRVVSDQALPSIVQAIENTLQMPKPDWDEESKVELKRHYEGIAKVLLRQWEKSHFKK